MQSIQAWRNEVEGEQGLLAQMQTASARCFSELNEYGEFWYGEQEQGEQ